MASQVPDHIAYVSPSFAQVVPHHEFNDIQSAIDWVPASGSAKIILYDDFVGIPELVLTNAETNITIDGLNQYGISFAGDVAEVGTNQTLKFRNMSYIHGEQVLLNSNGSVIGLYKVEEAIAYISLMSGTDSNVYVQDSKFYGTYGYCTIYVSNANAGIEILESFIQGGYGHPAISFSVSSDKKLNMKHSTMIHGAPDVLSPIESTGDFEIGVRVHNCSSNARICNDKIDNYIVNNNNNIGDIEIIF